MQPVRESRSNLALRAYRHIYRKLWRGEFSMGTKLPEVALAQEIGVSRTPVREAVAQLESEGFVIQIPNTGCFVRMMERDELDELFDFRMHLECYALELVMQSEQDQLLRHLRRLCDRMFKLIRRYHSSDRKRPADWQSFRSNWHLLDAEFHEQILQAARNRWISRVSGQLHLMSRIFMPGRKTTQEDDSIQRAIRIWREHRRIIQSIQRCDLEMGRTILRKHIEHGRRESMNFMDWVEAHSDDKPAERRKLPAELGKLLNDIIHLREVLAISHDSQ
jgi:GntR family transcriptional regulator of vanillate catabolism